MMQNFTSLPPDQEAAFLVYEQQQEQSLKTGLTIGAIAGIAVGAFIVLVSLAVDPAPNPHAQPAAGSQTQKADK
jgi:hypothetical protein